MPPVAPELLDRMVLAIVDEVDPDQVILFGSRARGEERDASGIDLLVIEAGPFGPGRSKHEEMNRLYHALREFRVPKDILVSPNEEVEYWRDSLNHSVARALREGKALKAWIAVLGGLYELSGRRCGSSILPGQEPRRTRPRCQP